MNTSLPMPLKPVDMSSELAAYYSNRRLMWRNLSLILLLNLGWATSFTVINPLIQLRLNHLGLTESGWGFISAANFWVYSYAVMYFAWKSDHTVTRFGRRIPYLFISAPIIILSVLLFPFVHTIWILVGLTLLQMLFTDIKAATIPLLNIDCMPRHLLARTAAPAAALTGIISFFSMRYGMSLAESSESLPYLFGGGLLVCTTLIGGFFIKEPPIQVSTTAHFRPWSAMQIAWKDKRAIILMISVSLFQTFQISYWTWIWLYTQNTLHFSRSETAYAMSWSILFGVVVALPIGWIIDRVSPYKMLPFLCLIGGVALWFLLHITSTAHLIVAAGLMTLVVALYNGSDIMVYRKANLSEIGSVTSTNACLRGFYNGCIGIISGFLIQQSGGHYEYAFILAYALTVLALAPLYYYRHLMST